MLVYYSRNVLIGRRLWLAVLLMVSFLFTETYQEETPQLAKDLKFKLRSGDPMPLIGLGTSQIRNSQVKLVLDRALAAGYRALDTADRYGNEEDIGKALKELLPKYNISRNEFFITTKLSPSDNAEETYQKIETSLRKLDSGYLDLYLIHWPGHNWDDSNRNQTDLSRLRDQRWQQMVKGVKNGLIKNIGVANYNIRHLKELLANDHGVKPSVNQVEWHPYNHQDDLLDFCKKEGILLEAYFSLGGTKNFGLLTDPEVIKVSKKLQKTSAQVLLRWSLQQNVAVIPKSRSKEHLEENLDLNFDIAEEDMKILNGLPQAKYARDPDTIA